MTIIRTTMFKIPSKENQLAFVEFYREVAKTAVKDGKPYIISLQAGPTTSDARNLGYTFLAKSEFKDLEDMKYYDEECEAHKVLKKLAAGKVEGGPPLTVVLDTESAVNVGV